MHVLITADTVGGVWTYTRELACGLVNRGHKVTLVSFGRIPSSAQVSWMVARNLDFYPTSFPLEWMTESEPGLGDSLEYLQALVHKVRPDVLHLSQFCYGSIDCDVPKVLVAHSDVLTWWDSVHGEAPPPSTWIERYSQTVSQGLQGADLVVTPSSWFLNILREKYKLRRPCKVIYNSRSAELFDGAQNKNDCAVTVGRLWDEGKQVKLLLARKQKMPVRIAGPTREPGYTQQPERMPDFGAGVEFCGEQSEVELKVLYGGAAVYVATSRYEPFGLAPVEAALSKCALLLNDIPVFRELWSNAACFFNRNDADSLSEALSMLHGDVMLRKHFADLAYERARSQFNPERMILEYEEAYETLVGTGAAA